MNATQFYVFLGIISLMVGLIVQATRGIFRVAQMKTEVMDAIKGIEEDVKDVKGQVQRLDQRVYDNAIRNPPGRR